MDKLGPLAVPEHVLRDMAAAEDTPTHRKISFLSGNGPDALAMSVRAAREVVERLEAQIEKHVEFAILLDSGCPALCLHCEFRFFSKEGEERILSRKSTYGGHESVRWVRADMEQFKHDTLATLVIEQEGFEAVPYGVSP